MTTRISERRGRLSLGAIAEVTGHFRLGHLCGVILAAGLAACSATPGRLVDAQSEVFSPVISRPGDAKTVAVFLHWHQGCVLGECDTPRVELHDQAAACIQTGLQRVDPDVRAVPGPEQLPQDTSALVDDPREKGDPDPRFNADLVAKLQNNGIRYALVLDISRTLGAPARATGVMTLKDPRAPSPMLWRRSHSSIRVRAEAILIDLDSRRWLARIRRDFKDSRDNAAAVILVGFVYPVPLFFGASQSSAGLNACNKVGEGLGNLFLGEQGLARLQARTGTFVTCKTTSLGTRRIAAGHCSAGECPVLEELCY